MGFAYPQMLLITPEGRFVVELFSGYVASVEDSAWNISFKTEEEFAEWLEEITERSTFQSDILPSVQDQILTCSTCSYDFDNARFVVHLHFNAGGEGTIVRYVAGHKVHRLHAPGIQLGKAFGDFGVALAIPQPAGNILLILPGKQAGSQHFPQVLVCFLRVSGKGLGNGAIPQVVFQKLFKPFPALGPENRVSHARGKKLYGIFPQLFDMAGSKVGETIHRTLNAIRGGQRLIPLSDFFSDEFPASWQNK